jgi:ATP synthase protein I
MSEDDAETQEKLRELTKHLEEVKRIKAESEPAAAKPPGDAARAAIDFATASAVGTVLGYGFDRWMDTSPWGLLVGLLIGTAAGVKMMFAEEARSKRKSEAAKTDNNQLTKE